MPGTSGRPETPDSGDGLLRCFGRQLKILRGRAGLSRAEFGQQIGYGEDLVSSVEQGRRIARPQFVEAADTVLDAGGVLLAAKDELAKAFYPAFFRDFAGLEAEALELYVYDTHVINGLLQTEDYARATFTMWRPLLDEETIEQRVAGRVARQELLTRKPAPTLGFVLDEAVLRRHVGDGEVMRGQFRRILEVGRMRNVEIQVMPFDRPDNAGLAGPFTLLTVKGRKQMAYLEGQERATLIADTEEVRTIALRYGIIRAQALTPSESMIFVEKLLGEA